MKKFKFQLFLSALIVPLILLAAPRPAAAYYPLGGVWEYKGSASVMLGGKQVIFKEEGRITADADYSYDWWRDVYEEWIYSFRAKGKFAIDGATQEYNHYKRLNERYRGSPFTASFDGARYVVKITGRLKAGVEITRTVSGKTFTATFPAERIRWDDDWDRYYDGGPFYGVSAGCNSGRVHASSLLLVLPLLLLIKPR
ncbi:MAG: hypothetical protein GX310_11790 [Synergistaceae bacterium]|nr:hypothetical protein [Synergistaceae bacterium]